MHLTRRTALAGLAGLAAAPGAAIAQTAPGSLDGAIRALLAPRGQDVNAAGRVILEANDLSAVPGLILALRYSSLPNGTIAHLLSELTGEPPSLDWFTWMLWQEAHPEVRPTPGFVEMKRELFLAIDPNFEVFLRPEHLRPEAMDIRFEEIAWGGVRKDGIPSLDNPARIAADEADYLRGDDLVFGVSINGDTRAYPLRIMGWHEMFNEVIGGVPVALAYCTLCGSGILFETDVPTRPKPFIFGSSGFLYRSNKLMFDRETHSLWNQFTGRPVSGELRGSGIALRQRPVVIAPWAEWRRQNPETTVLSLETGHVRNYGSGIVYADYFDSESLMFPALVDETVLAQKDYIFGIRTFAASKAWPLEAFDKTPVINDRIGDLPVVLVGDYDGRSVRAYERGDLTFEAGSDPAMLRASDTAWRIGEEALTSATGQSLPRVAGHIAYWFAWNNYLGLDAELYQY